MANATAECESLLWTCQYLGGAAARDTDEGPEGPFHQFDSPFACVCLCMYVCVCVHIRAGAVLSALGMASYVHWGQILVQICPYCEGGCTRPPSAIRSYHGPGVAALGCVALHPIADRRVSPATRPWWEKRTD